MAMILIPTHRTKVFHETLEQRSQIWHTGDDVLKSCQREQVRLLG